MKKTVKLVTFTTAFAFSAIASIAANAAPSHQTSPWDATYTVTCTDANNPSNNWTEYRVRYPEKELLVSICEYDGGTATVRVHN